MNDNTNADGRDSQGPLSIAGLVQIGAQCSECGTRFEDEHGHPVLCRDCYQLARDEHRKPTAPRAQEKEL